MNRRLLWSIGMLLAISAVLMAVRSLQAQTSQICFSATGFCIEGRFRQFWEQNGGLPIFGFTIGPQQELGVEGGHFLAQWLERSRFELHPENAPPYDTLLGRLGDDRLRQLGRDWQAEPRAGGPQPGCLWFAQTGHNVCDQARGVGFMSYWRSHGLLDPRLDAYGHSLALFGLPLTEPALERNPTDGQVYLTQWFERARFEWHPNEPDDQYKVLLGLLGNEMLGRGLLPTLEPPTPTNTQVPTPKPPKPTILPRLLTATPTSTLKPPKPPPRPPMPRPVPITNTPQPPKPSPVPPNTPTAAPMLVLPLMPI